MRKLLWWCALLIAPACPGATFFDLFTDPADGGLDAGSWLLDKKGLMVLPVPITEPAVGYGLALGLAYTQGPLVKESGSSSDALVLSPSNITGGAVAATENGTWGAGVFHLGFWREDQLRYRGALVYPEINLKFYQPDDDDDSTRYTLRGWSLDQQLLARVGQSAWLVGGDINFWWGTNELQLDNPVGPRLDFEQRLLGAALIAQIDTADNYFTPREGLQSEFKLSGFHEFGDNSFNFGYFTVRQRLFWQMRRAWVVGWRLVGDFSFGDVPFYALPDIELRGIPRLRYQNENALFTELEVRWDLAARWRVAGFVGTGRVARKFSDLDTAKDRVAGGAGFRYLFVRRLGTELGLDVARGPDDWEFYVQFGHTWLRD